MTSGYNSMYLHSPSITRGFNRSRKSTRGLSGQNSEMSEECVETPAYDEAAVEEKGQLVHSCVNVCRGTDPPDDTSCHEIDAVTPCKVRRSFQSTPSLTTSDASTKVQKNYKRPYCEDDNGSGEILKRSFSYKHFQSRQQGYRENGRGSFKVPIGNGRYTFKTTKYSIRHKPENECCDKEYIHIEPTIRWCGVNANN